MRAPSPSFRGELAAYRQDLVADRQHFSDQDYAFAVEILDRWEMRQADIDELWTTITAKCPDWPPREFILDVLASSRTASKLDAVVRELPKCEGVTANRAKRHMTNKQFRRAANELEMLGTVLDLRQRLLSRKVETAARGYFMKGWSEKFEAMCGQPLDEVVRVLTEIAFDGEVKPEAVRDARKHRDIRPPK
jgi:hypothetical protein